MRIALLFLVAFLIGCSGQKEPGKLAAGPPAIDLTTFEAPTRDRVLQLKQAVEQQPDNADNWGKLGQAFHALELYDAAEHCYHEAARLDPQSARWQYLAGIVRLRDATPLGLTNLATAVSLGGQTNDFLRLAYGKALAERGHTREAQEQFEKLLAAEPNHPAARLELARLKLAANNPQPAADLLQPCLTNQFTARPAHLLLGQAKLKLGDARAAAQLAQRAASLPEPFDWPDPYLREMKNSIARDENIIDQANRFLLAGRAADTERLLSAVLQQDPNHPDALLILGRLRSQQQRFAEAESLFQKHLAVRTNSVQGWMQLGITRFRQEQWPAAADAFTQAIRIKPDYAEAHANLGFAYSRQGQIQRAIESFQNALRCQPADARAHASLAEEYLRAGQKREAAQSAAAALAINPQEPRALRVITALKSSP